MPTIGFLGFSPDLDPSTPGVLTDMDFMLATDRGFFKPQPFLEAFGSTLTLAALGAIQAVYLDGTIRYFVGTAPDLLEVTGPGGTWTAVDGGTAFSASSTLPGGGWRFAVFGNRCIAQNGVDDPVAAGPTGNFAAITPPSGQLEMPRARVIASVANNFVVIGDVTVSPDETAFPASGDRWWTCAQNDYTNWTPSVAFLSSTGRLLDTPGPIKAIRTIGRNLDFAVYKLKATYLAHFVGSPIIWQFIPIDRQVGAFSQESIVELPGEVHAFPSYDDFWLFNGSNLQRLESPLRSWFYSRLNLGALENGTANILGAFDRKRDIAYWYFPSSAATVPNEWVAWNLKSNKWTKGVLGVEAVMDREVLVNGVPVVAVFQIDHRMYSLSGPPNPLAYLTTGDIGDHHHMFLVTRIRPKFAEYVPSVPVGVSTFNVTGFTKLNLGATAVQRMFEVPLSQFGWIDIRQAGRWHSFQFNFGQTAELIGMDITLVQAGER